ncbi:MAG: alkaline phosphatase family protein [Pirellulaceae bacterium]
MANVVVLNAVGLTPELLPHAPRLASCGVATPWKGSIPAVTSTCQATMLTGKPPNQHGIVANGWYFRDTAEIRFWQQSNHLVEGEKFYEGYPTAKMFWWYNQHAPVTWSATPKPHYGCDGSKVFDILDQTGCRLTDRLGAFPFWAFWGPKAGLDSTQWIAKATSLVLREQRPQLTLVYLPHLDYDFQRYDIQDPQRVAELDRCAGEVLDAAESIGAIPIVVSEYGLSPVHHPIYLQRALRQAGYLEIRKGPFGEMLIPGDCRAFAVVDHQIAHIYVKPGEDRIAVRRLVESIEGVDLVAEPGDLQLDHPRSGDWIAVAKPDAWFAYPYWRDDSAAPDFARTVDIHRKPGYDPAELFMTSGLRAAGRLFQKKLGFRYRMDVVPLDASLVRGSHGRLVEGPKGPLVIGPAPPEEMTSFFGYVRSLLGPPRLQ